MEIDVKEQENNLRAELAQLQTQLQQIEQARNNLVSAVLQKKGALELVLSFNGKKKTKEPI